MYERFTDKAQKVIQLANYEAQRFGHEYIGTEHILLGLIKEGTGVAANILKNLHVDVLKIRQEIERIVESGPKLELETRGKLPMTPRAKQVLTYAMEESRTLNHNYVGTEHILLGLLREQEGVASQVLMAQGLRVDEVREEVRKLLGGGSESISLDGPRSLGALPVTHSDSQPAGCELDSSRSADRESNALFERFTDRALKAMRFANQEAQRLNHEYVGTEHLLLGLVKEGSGVAANVLKNLDVDLCKTRAEAEKIVPAGPDLVILGRLPQTPRARKAIEYAKEEAFNLSHNYVGTEHLLLGLLREQEGVAAQVLKNLGIKLDDVRAEVLNLLGHGQ